MTSLSYSDLIADVNPSLSIPNLQNCKSVLECSQAYAECGWWIVPVTLGSKNPGSILGQGWPAKSTRDTNCLNEWFKGRNDRGIALHTGKSRALVLDVDHPSLLSPAVRKLLSNSGAPYQSTRFDSPGRGHYVFALPNGINYSNSANLLGRGWGEIRTGNTVIITEPTSHQKAKDGGRYKWSSIGDVPVIPKDLSSKLRVKAFNSGLSEASQALNDTELEEFLNGLTESLAPSLLEDRLAQRSSDFVNGSRHDALLHLLLVCLRDSRAGLYPASDLVESALNIFCDTNHAKSGRLPASFGMFFDGRQPLSKTLPRKSCFKSEQRVLPWLRLG